MSAPNENGEALRTTKLCTARFCLFACIFFANNFAHSNFAMLAIGSSPVITVYLTLIKRKIADNRILPFPVNGSPSARFRKRNVNDVGKPTRTRPEARGADNRTLFRSLLLFCLYIFDCKTSFIFTVVARYRGRGGKQPFHRLFGRIVLSSSFNYRLQCDFPPVQVLI